MEDWEQILTAAGHRITAPRQAIMQVLAQSETPLSPQEILERGLAYHVRLGLVTVYRTLELFEEFGLACRVHLAEGCHGYVLRQPGHRHVLLCQECGRSIEFSGQDDLDTLVARVAARTGYRIADHWLQLFGVCPACQEIET
ncbi:MAG: transcriptional repressor [Anaerolineae bacterium]|nr:transcriptional repressor [Anaerolineae bacterium]